MIKKQSEKRKTKSPQILSIQNNVLSPTYEGFRTNYGVEKTQPSIVKNRKLTPKKTEKLENVKYGLTSIGTPARPCFNIFNKAKDDM